MNTQSSTVASRPAPEKQVSHSAPTHLLLASACHPVRRLFSLRLAALASVMLVGGAYQAAAQSYLIDFGAANFTTVNGPALGDDPVNFWNNLTADLGSSSTAQLPNLVATDNAPSTISLVMLSRFNGANEAGTLEPTIFPSDATRDSLFGNTEIFGTLENIFPSFKFTGLNPQTSYDLTFFASRAGVNDNRETGYTVTGATTGFAALDPVNNISNLVTIAGMSPDAAGEITISLAPTANNNNANHFTYLGVLKLDAIPPQTPISFTLEPVSQRVAEFESVTFRSAVLGPPPYFIQWWSNEVAIPNANQFNYTIPSATTNMNGLRFSVSVSNLLYGAMSSNAVLRVVSDTNPPTVVSVSSPDGATIEVVFNELMDVGTATDAFNFSVNLGTVGVASSVLGVDGKTVTLTLGLGETISGTFTVTMSVVADASGNPIEPGTTVTGRVFGPEDYSFLFDFGGSNTTERGPSPDDPTNYWNNVTATIGTVDGGQLTGLVTTRNLITPLGLTILRRFNSNNENGIQNSGIFPTDATRDSLFGNTELFGPLANVFPSFKLTGVYPGVTYKLTFFASRTGVGDNRETGYTVTAGTSGFAALNAANNIANVAVVSGIVADAAGEITISLAPTANNNNANHFTYLGVMKVEPMPAVLRFLAPVIQDNQIRLEWTGSGDLEWASSITGPWTTIAPAATSPYSETVVPGENRFYRLKRSNP